MGWGKTVFLRLLSIFYSRKKPLFISIFGRLSKIKKLTITMKFIRWQTSLHFQSRFQVFHRERKLIFELSFNLLSRLGAAGYTSGCEVLEVAFAVKTKRRLQERISNTMGSPLGASLQLECYAHRVFLKKQIRGIPVSLCSLCGTGNYWPSKLCMLVARRDTVGSCAVRRKNSGVVLLFGMDSRSLFVGVVAKILMKTNNNKREE